jgi:hypothetical protein
MANRQFAPADARTDGRENTARVVMHKSTLPGWFWGMLGCFSVLGVGFVVLIFVAKNGFLDGGAVAPGTASAAAALAPVAPAATPHAGPQIEQMDRSAAPAVVPSVAPARVPATAPAALDSRPKVPPHPIKLARSPSGGHSTTKASAAGDKAAGDKASSDDAPSDKAAASDKGDDSAAAKKPADKAASDDDQVVRHHKTAASDDDDDTDTDN